MGITLAIGDGISPEGFTLWLTETGLWLHEKNHIRFYGMWKKCAVALPIGIVWLSVVHWGVSHREGRPQVDVGRTGALILFFI